MNCKHAQSSIALVAGDDLNGSSRKELAGHLARCPECREYQREMQGALSVLQSPAREPAWSSRDSVWPEVSSYLAAVSQPSSLRQQFNGWMPALTVIAACSLMLIFARSQADLQQAQAPVILPPGDYVQPVAFEPGPPDGWVGDAPDLAGPGPRWNFPDDELSNPNFDELLHHVLTPESRGVPNNR